MFRPNFILLNLFSFEPEILDSQSKAQKTQSLALTPLHPVCFKNFAPKHPVRTWLCASVTLALKTIEKGSKDWASLLL